MRLLACALLVSMVSSAFAADAARGTFVVSGSPQSELTLAIGEAGGTHAIRVYAEPSHSLLAIFANGTNGALSDGADAWMRTAYPGAKYPPRFPLATFPFAAGQRVGMHVPVAPPSTDTTFAIEVIASPRDVRTLEVPLTN